MNDRWQEIERIYDAARELDGSARTAYLAQTCTGDSALRRQVEFLLAQDERAGSFLEWPAIEVAAESVAKDEHLLDPAKPVVEIGTMVAHYRVTARLGAGGNLSPVM